jgi:myotubularin-related protein 1/2
LRIFDARSKINAMANKMNNGGYENTDYYTNCSIDFMDIDNIHGVREAITKMYDISREYDSPNYNSRFLT